MSRFLAFLFVISLSFPAWGDEIQDMRREMEEMKQTLQKQNATIEKQQRRIDELENRVGAGTAAGTAPYAPVEQTPAPVSVSSPEPTAPGAPAAGPAGRPGALPGQIGSLLPEIGLVGDIVATSSEDKADAEGNDRIAVRELELVLGSSVDPYSRFDANIAFSDFEEVAVEEAYLTRWGLPADLTVRFGRFFPKVGKQASIHRDSLPTVDEPLVIRRYFGVEGYNKTGVDLTRIFDGPANWVFQPAFGVLEGGTGEEGTVFGGSRRRPTIYSHLKTYTELGDSAGFELGGTHMLGSSDDDSEFEVNVFGVDATYLNNLTPTSKLLLQSEVFVQHRDESFTVGEETIDVDDGTGTGGTVPQVVPVVTSFNRHPWGAYFLADYRFAPRWSVGGRVDHVRLSDTPGRSFDQGFSAFLTFYQSEWARWRLQYRHEERATEPTDDAVFLQGTFAIGTHKHKIQ